MSPTETMLVLLAVSLAHQAVAQAQTGLGCSWTTSTTPSILDSSLPDSTTDAVFSASNAVVINQETATAAAEGSVTAVQRCSGTAIRVGPATPGVAASRHTFESQHTTSGSHLRSTDASSSESHVMSASIPDSLPPTHSVTAVVRPSIRDSSSTRQTTFQTSISRPINDVPNLPLSLPVEFIPSSHTFTTSVPAKVGTPEQSVPTPSRSTQTSSESMLALTTGSMVWPARNTTFTTSVSAAQTIQSTSAAPTNYKISPTLLPCPASKSQTQTSPATSTAPSDAAELPPAWTPESTSSTSTAVCTHGSMTFECANPTATPSKFNTRPMEPTRT